MGPSLIAQPLSPRAFGPSFAPVGPRLSLAGYPVWVVCPTGQDSATAMPIGLLSCLPPSARTLSGPLDGGRDRHGVARGSPPTTHFHPIKNPTDGTAANRCSVVPRNDKTWPKAHPTSQKVPRQAANGLQSAGCASHNKSHNSAGSEQGSQFREIDKTCSGYL